MNRKTGQYISWTITTESVAFKNSSNFELKDCVEKYDNFSVLYSKLTSADHGRLEAAESRSYMHLL